jgi:hypothetical protein
MWNLDKDTAFLNSSNNNNSICSNSSKLLEQSGSTSHKHNIMAKYCVSDTTHVTRQVGTSDFTPLRG